jgi:ParB/RepB/Spo0J family partition protein
MPLPELLAVSIDQLKEHPLNARKVFDVALMQELEASIRDKGIKTPLLVRPNGKGYEVIAGHRRLRCAKAIGLEQVPVLAEKMDDDTALELLLVDNLQREGLHPLEEAEGYKHLLETKSKYDVERIARRVGRSLKYVYDRVKLLQLTKDMQKIFRAGEITLGHAIIIARLGPAEQARLLDKGEDAGYMRRGEAPLFQAEDTLFDPDDKAKETRKPISVRELQSWVDAHVKLEAPEVDPMLFPETAVTLEQAQATEEKVVRITHETMTPDELKDGPRAILGNSWKRADGKAGSKTCDRSVIGMLVIGPNRGETLRVCVDKKKCTKHWGKPAKKRAAGGAASSTADYYEKQRKREEAEQRRQHDEQQRWKAALPTILKAIAAGLRKASVATLAGVLVDGNKEASEYLPLGKTADDLVRHLAFLEFHRKAVSWWGPQELPKMARPLGLDVKKLLAAAAPLEARCRECGCTEAKACKVEDLDGEISGCSWLEKPDKKTGLGLCSAAPCAKKYSKKPKRKA